MLLEKFTIEQTLNVLIDDIGIDKFRRKPNHIRKEFPRRKTYSNLWIVGNMPWFNENEEIPRKWNELDDKDLRNFIKVKYDKDVTFTVIKDAILCLKNRCSEY